MLLLDYCYCSKQEFINTDYNNKQITNHNIQTRRFHFGLSQYIYLVSCNNLNLKGAFLRLPHRNLFSCAKLLTELHDFIQLSFQWKAFLLTHHNTTLTSCNTTLTSCNTTLTSCNKWFRQSKAYNTATKIRVLQSLNYFKNISSSSINVIYVWRHAFGTSHTATLNWMYCTCAYSKTSL